MKDRRYKAITPVTDFNVSQRIRVQLIEDGHTELAVESITQPIRDIEEDLGAVADAGRRARTRKGEVADRIGRVSRDRQESGRRHPK